MALNSKQRGLVIAAAAIFIAMGLYPSWTYTSYSNLYRSEKSAGYM